MNPAPLDVSTAEGLVDALISQGKTLADLRGISPEELEVVHAAAYDALEAGNVRQAFEQAAFLVCQDPWDRRFHLIAAVCLQQLGQFDAAYRSYAQALLFEATDAVCLFRLAECLEAMGEQEDARQAYLDVVKLSWGGQDYADVREAAQARLDEWGGLVPVAPREGV